MRNQNPAVPTDFVGPWVVGRRGQSAIVGRASPETDLARVFRGVETIADPTVQNRMAGAPGADGVNSRQSSAAGPLERNTEFSSQADRP
jgi:hypothetical protein